MLCVCHSKCFRRRDSSLDRQSLSPNGACVLKWDDSHRIKFNRGVQHIVQKSLPEDDNP